MITLAVDFVQEGHFELTLRRSAFCWPGRRRNLVREIASSWSWSKGWMPLAFGRKKAYPRLVRNRTLLPSHSTSYKWSTHRGPNLVSPELGSSYTHFAHLRIDSVTQEESNSACGLEVGMVEWGWSNMIARTSQLDVSIRPVQLM